jgi:3-phenylpropionate/trans-cinnamate dioxygenase ferredoxin subunit
VILLTKIQDEYYAIDNKCPHMGGSLYDGDLDGNNITCPRHGSVFDVRTGKSLKAAKIAFVKIKVDDTPAYPVEIEGDDILIALE